MYYYYKYLGKYVFGGITNTVERFAVDLPAGVPWTLLGHRQTRQEAASCLHTALRMAGRRDFPSVFACCGMTPQARALQAERKLTMDGDTGNPSQI
jgi:hypothetical protein